MTTDLKRIRHLFEQKMGLDTSLISDEGWHRIVKERMAICEINNLSQYVQRLFSSSIEFQEFVELLVVPETWFFRDKASVEFIVDHAIKEWVSHPKSHPIRILCLPSSSGEEPYSIAMMFAHEYFPANLLHIDGVDISKRALAKAEIGEYNKNSFRTKDLTFRDQFFTKVESNYILAPAIRQMVHFSFGNLFDSSLKELRLPYDVIFCRNLFIYLHGPAQKKGIETFKELLTSEGILVVGPAEAEIVRSFGFVPFGPLKACAFKYQKKQEKILIVSKDLAGKSKKSIETVLSTPVSTEKKDEKVSLEKAQQLADLGQLSEALSICHECLKECNTDPKVYFLIGLIEHAQGHEKISEEYFLKTVYLDPNYYEALFYLALMAEKHGEFAQAELFRTRAKRLGEKRTGNKDL